MNKKSYWERLSLPKKGTILGFTITFSLLLSFYVISIFFIDLMVVWVFFLSIITLPWSLFLPPLYAFAFTESIGEGMTAVFGRYFIIYFILVIILNTFVGYLIGRIISKQWKILLRDFVISLVISLIMFGSFFYVGTVIPREDYISNRIDCDYFDSDKYSAGNVELKILNQQCKITDKRFRLYFKIFVTNHNNFPVKWSYRDIDVEGNDNNLGPFQEKYTKDSKTYIIESGETIVLPLYVFVSNQPKYTQDDIKNNPINTVLRIQNIGLIN